MQFKWIKFLALGFFSLINQTSSEELGSLYQIHDNVLVNYQGDHYPKIAYSDQLHEELYFALKDPEQAEIIYQAYSKHLQEALPEELKVPFSRSLLKVCYLFGSAHFSPQSALIQAFKEEPTIHSWICGHETLLSNFCLEANCPARQTHLKNKAQDPFTIVILTTTSSGGNHSVACAMMSFLATDPDIRCIVVDTEEIAKKTDLIMLATGATTYDGIYEKFFQQRNQGFDVLVKRDQINKELRAYIPSRFGLELKEHVRSLNPGLILSTRSYTLDDIPLCTLGIPFRMIHCDYELSFFLMDLYGKISSEMMKFWLPAFEPDVFKPLFAKANRMDIYNEKDDTKTLLEKIALITDQSVENIQKEFELFGFPVLPEFYTMESTIHLREKWGINEEEIPVLVSMGKNGVGTLEKIFDELQESKSKLPIQYIFVCGKNSDLKARLEQKNKSQFKICGLLSAEGMNELMNLCPLYISKPGGAVTAETLETPTHLAFICSHPWEEVNGSYIEQIGQGIRLDENKPLSLQIEDYLENRLHQKRSSFSNAPWKESLMNLINTLR